MQKVAVRLINVEQPVFALNSPSRLIQRRSVITVTSNMTQYYQNILPSDYHLAPSLSVCYETSRNKQKMLTWPSVWLRTLVDNPAFSSFSFPAAAVFTLSVVTFGDAIEFKACGMIWIQPCKRFRLVHRYPLNGKRKNDEVVWGVTGHTNELYAEQKNI